MAQRGGALLGKRPNVRELMVDQRPGAVVVTADATDTGWSAIQRLVAQVAICAMTGVLITGLGRWLARRHRESNGLPEIARADHALLPLPLARRSSLLAPLCRASIALATFRTTFGRLLLSLYSRSGPKFGWAPISRVLPHPGARSRSRFARRPLRVGRGRAPPPRPRHRASGSMRHDPLGLPPAPFRPARPSAAPPSPPPSVL